MPKTIVHIANPAAGGAAYTSAERAIKFALAERAVFLDDGRLWFYTSAQVLANREAARERQVQSTRVNGTTVWNGSDENPLATHRPGEARS